MQLASSILQVTRVQRSEALAKRNEENVEKVTLAPIALAKLEKNNEEADRLTKKEIVAVLWVNYSITMSESGNKKQKLLDALRDKMQYTPNDDSKTSGTINND